jgi:hypothetical protein
MAMFAPIAPYTAIFEPATKAPLSLVGRGGYRPVPVVEALLRGVIGWVDLARRDRALADRGK